VGQFTPGPFSSVTFWGLSNQWNLIHFYAGDISTLICICCTIESYGKKKETKPFATFLDAVNVASISIIVAICYELDTITDWRTIVIALLSIVIVFKYKKINSAFVV
jgi:chromate transporter